jgi:hypothetical protein
MGLVDTKNVTDKLQQHATILSASSLLYQGRNGHTEVGGPAITPSNLEKPRRKLSLSERSWFPIRVLLNGGLISAALYYGEIGWFTTAVLVMLYLRHELSDYVVLQLGKYVGAKLN